VNHGHIMVNNKTVNIPSYQVKPNDVITLKKRAKNVPQVLQAIEINP